MAIQLKNNASSTLASGITAAATSLTVATGTGSTKFPVLTGSDYFYLTISIPSGANEIVKVTATSADTFTIIRAQDGTTAQAWNAGDSVGMRVTAGTLVDCINNMIDASIDGIPAILPALNLNFINSRVLDPRITFTRASTATYFDQNDLLKIADTNQPRFDFDPVTLSCKGLLIEESRTNLLTYSEQFDNAAWGQVSCSISPNVATAPDGTLSADKLISANSIAFASSTLRQAVTKSATATTYTYSIYAKPSEFNRCRILLRDYSASANNATVTVSLVDGSVVSSAVAAGTFTSASSAVTQLANGWFRVSLTCTSSTETQLLAGVYAYDSVATTGNGTSGIYIWGAQLEAGSFPTSYIPTTTAQVTRAADIATMTGTNFSSWYNQTEGTFDAKYIRLAVSTVGTDGYVFNAADLGTSSRIAGYQINATSDGFLILNAGATQAAITAGATSANSKLGLSCAFKANDFASSLNGLAVVTDTSGIVPTVDRLHIGSRNGSLNFLNGHIATLTYYNTRLADSYLPILSK